MPSFSATKQKISKSQYSFSNLSQTTSAGESTKKTIEPQQIISYQAESIKDSKISFSLPYSVQIPSIVTHLTNLFSEEIIHVQEDTQGGKILLNGVKNMGKRRYLINMLDCFGLFCWRFGLNGGSLYDSYSVVSISIKKEILNNRCFVSVEQLPYHVEDKKLFMEKVVNKIQSELKKIDCLADRWNEGSAVTRYLSYDSIFLQEMEVKEKIHNIFIYEKDKKWQRFRRLFRKSEDTIREKIEEFKTKSIQLQQQQQKEQISTTKSGKKGQPTHNPSTLLQCMLTESDSLYKILLNYYQKEVEDEHEQLVLAGLLSSPVQKEFTLYSIEDLVASPFMDAIIECYQISTDQQSKLFNKNAKQITQKLSHSECFDYLELRDKFRLLSSNQPYHPSIEMLKTIHNSPAPREMLLNIQKVFSSVKVDCLKASQGKIELSSMDDLLPVMIYVTLKAAVYNFPALVKLVDDYVRLKGVFQLEERIITTLYVAVEDITKKWNT